MPLATWEQVDVDYSTSDTVRSRGEGVFRASPLDIASLIDVNRGGFKLRTFHVNENSFVVENFIVKIRAYKTANQSFFNNKFVIFGVNQRIR